MLDVYHAGELAVQERVGVRALAERRAAGVSERLSEGARAFLSQQSVAAVAAEAPDGTVWASLWCGDAGAFRADETGALVSIAAERALTADDDVVRPLLHTGSRLGMVVIDFATRRRLRINGVVHHMDSAGLEVQVREAFGNCVKYIQRRQRNGRPEPFSRVRSLEGGLRDGSALSAGRGLDDDRRAFIERTDTLFVASINRERGLDVSHRGGEPGFVRVVDDGTLRIPDYEGNSMYQTLGNFELDPRAGLALIDFEGQRILSVTGRAAIEFGADDPRHPSGGTGRYWTFKPDRWVEYSLPPSITWTLVDRSPFNPAP
jgi:predicted pyridoxine 5'-phosphate oxidase superfamily flavin-nucleotide-binding protein